MNDKTQKLSGTIGAILLSLLVSASAVSAQEITGESETLSREVGSEIEAVVTAVDVKTREVALKSGFFQFTVYAPEGVINLEDISVGDSVASAFSAAVEVELRAPTAAELAQPWEVLEEGALTGEGNDVSVEKARLVRAVVAVSVMDKAKGVIIVKDSRGMMHLIAHVEPEKLTDLNVGDKVVVLFTESIAVTFEPKS